jgi:hypothetical protein
MNSKLVVPKFHTLFQSVNQHQFQRCVADIFGRFGPVESIQLSRELRSQVVRLNLNGIECQLSFHFFTELQVSNCKSIF